MKYRSSFVSNSSSSSFVALVSKEAHDKVINNLSPWAQEVIHQLLIESGGSEPKKLFGKEVYVFHELSVQSFNSWNYLEIDVAPTDEDEETYSSNELEVFWHYLSMIPEEEQISNSIDD